MITTQAAPLRAGSRILRASVCYMLHVLAQNIEHDYTQVNRVLIMILLEIKPNSLY